MANLEARMQKLIHGSGVNINGKNPWDIQVHDPRFYRRILAGGSLALGESYMDGWWDSDQIDVSIARLLQFGIRSKLLSNPILFLNALRARLMNVQSKRASFSNAQAHYDIGNDLYRAMLDRRLTYTCGYWKDAKTLDEAQEAKLDLVCRKLGLKRGERVLDIGCGWGSFAKFAAEKYGAHVVGITVAKEQIALGSELCKGLPVELRLQDYRDINEPFDHIVSLGMFEHVGFKNYRQFMKVVSRCMSDDGLFLLHTIASNRSVFTCDPWFNKYIFPGGMLPSIAQIGKAVEEIFVMEDWHNFGADYDKTLMAWFANFDKHWGVLKQNYSDRFYRMWKYYLLSLAGGFRARENQLWQIVFSKKGVPGGYRSIR